MGKTDGATYGATTRTRNLTKPISDQIPIQPPSNLSGDALTYWLQVTPYLANAGLISPPEVPQLCELCDCYAILQESKRKMKESGEGLKSYHDTITKFIQMAKLFLLWPADRRRNSVSYQDNSDRHDDLGAFQW